MQRKGSHNRSAIGNTVVNSQQSSVDSSSFHIAKAQLIHVQALVYSSPRSGIPTGKSLRCVEVAWGFFEGILSFVTTDRIRYHED